MSYSSDHQVNKFMSSLHPSQTDDTRPVFILDMDGNVCVGYALNEGVSLPLLEGVDDAETQSIPSGVNAEELVGQGLAKRGIFAAKSNDARLAPELVDKINELAEQGDHLSICLLTSRRYADVGFILRESGINDPESMTIVADSGNLLHINGQTRHVRILDEREQTYIDRIEHEIGPRLNQDVKVMLTEAGHDTNAAPNLFIEPKGSAINIHFRGLFEKMGIGEDSDLGKKIAQHIGQELDTYVSGRDVPKEEDGSPVFKLGPGPMTFEVKLANVTKANGMEAIVEELSAVGRHPDRIVFAGDDCAKKPDGDTYGTDYYAMKWSSDHLGDKGAVIHTHHPENGAFDGVFPDPRKKAPEHLKIDLITRTPLETVEIVVNGVKSPAPTPSYQFNNDAMTM